jgi:hypothetical protein
VQRRRAASGTTLAELAASLVGTAAPIRATADGRMLGWYRLGTADGPLPADTRLESLDADALLHMHFVRSRSILLDVTVTRPEGPVRLRLPGASAVPVATVLDAITATLDLAPGEWTISLDDRALDPFEILADRGVGDVVRLVVAAPARP